MRKTAGILTACLLLAGCAAGQRPGMSRPQLPPTQPTVIETPVAVTEPTAAPGERLLLVEYNLQGGTIRPVDGLTLVDLPAHQPISIRHHFDHAFSPDGAALYWLQPASKEPAHGAPREFALVRYSVSNGGGTQPVVQFPPSFMPGSYRLLGDRLAVYGMSGRIVRRTTPM